MRLITIKKQKIKIFHNNDIKKLHYLLLLEIDYELAGLSYALKHNNQQEITELKNRLSALTIELQSLEKTH